MPHKLWIYPTLVPPRKYKKFLSYFEVVATTENTIELTIENIGKKTFPGGKLAKPHVDFEMPIGFATLSSSRGVNPEIPPIEPNKSFSIKIEWFPRSPGIWRITTKIKPRNRAKIEYYQSPKAPPLEEDEWFQILYAVDRHQLDLTLRLERFLKKKS